MRRLALMEDVIIQIIVHGGDARVKSMTAIQMARKGEFEKARSLIIEAKEAVSKAHHVQTNLIQSEVRGEKCDVSLLMVHAQDHLMNAMTVKELAEVFVEEIEARLALEKRLNSE